MARPLRIDYPGAWHHVFNRGQRREPIFADNDDRRSFIDLVSHLPDRMNVQVAAYCLMDNHYHLVLHTPDGRLADALRHVDGVYTQRFNRRWGHDGALFRGRYGSRLVQEGSYLWQLMRYVHRNPVEAGMTRAASDYPWSSARAFLGFDRRPAWLTTAGLDVAGIDSRSAFRAMIDDDFEVEEAVLDLGLAAIGDLDWVEQRLAAVDPVNLPVHDERTGGKRPTVLETIEELIGALQIEKDDVLTPTPGKANPIRKLAIWVVHRRTGASYATIADAFGTSPGGMASIVNQMRKAPPISDEEMNLLLCQT